MRSLLSGTIRKALFNLVKSDRHSVTFCSPYDPVGQSIVLWGHYEGQIIEDLGRIVAERLPESHDLAMLDVGANIGTHSVGLAHLFSRVVAFEPNPVVSLVAMANVKAAGL